MTVVEDDWKTFSIATTPCFHIHEKRVEKIINLNTDNRFNHYISSSFEKDTLRMTVFSKVYNGRKWID